MKISCLRKVIGEKKWTQNSWVQARQTEGKTMEMDCTRKNRIYKNEVIKIRVRECF
ncbi:hypothetical protein PGB90_001058 [Kerria lacca]